MSLLHLQNTKLVIFDFDGTIADTSEGIIDAHKYTLSKMNIDVPIESELRFLIGGNLLKIYDEHFGLGPIKAREAVGIYRNRYREVGIHKAAIYNDLEIFLSSLQKRRIKTSIATLKSEKFAKIMTEELKINRYFTEVCGMDDKDSFDKAGIINEALKRCGIPRDKALLIGDSNNDYEGAISTGVSFIGVTYGFGFRVGNEYPFEVAHSMKDLCTIFGLS